jgi:16S rRNA C967 or C1407 C5-methylase (RsmB/RsmF family)
LIRSAYENLKKKGTLVYSTCSVEPEENEGVVSYLLDNFDVKLEKISLDVKGSEPILEFKDKEYNKEVKKCLRIWPQDNDTDGFFVAKIKKL